MPKSYLRKIIQIKTLTDVKMQCSDEKRLKSDVIFDCRLRHLHSMYI